MGRMIRVASKQGEGMMMMNSSMKSTRMIQKRMDLLMAYDYDMGRRKRKNSSPIPTLKQYRQETQMVGEGNDDGSASDSARRRRRTKRGDGDDWAISGPINCINILLLVTLAYEGRRRRSARESGFLSSSWSPWTRVTQTKDNDEGRQP